MFGFLRLPHETLLCWESLLFGGTTLRGMDRGGPRHLRIGSIESLQDSIQN